MGVGITVWQGGLACRSLDGMDRHFEDKGFNDTNLCLKPSEYFKRQCWISFEPVESSLSVLADYIGPHRQAPGAVGGDQAQDSGRGRYPVL